MMLSGKPIRLPNSVSYMYNACPFSHIGTIVMYRKVHYESLVGRQSNMYHE